MDSSAESEPLIPKQSDGKSPYDILLMASSRAGSRVICCQFPFRVFLPLPSRVRLGFNESVMQEMHISFCHCQRALSLNKGNVCFFSQGEYNTGLLCGFMYKFGTVFCFVFVFCFPVFFLLNGCSDEIILKCCFGVYSFENSF